MKDGFEINRGSGSDFSLKYATRALELLGKIAEVDMNFRLGKITTNEAWKQVHKILQKDKESECLY